MGDPNQSEDRPDAELRRLPLRNALALAFGLAFFALSFAAVAWDALLYVADCLTISEVVLAFARRGVWQAAVVGLVLVLPSMLLGHFVIPTHGPRPWLPALVGGLVAVPLGMVLGYLVFPQSGGR
jgi:hypothetical protein